jgi:hypothetical protein
MDRTSVFQAGAFLFSAALYLPYIQAIRASNARPTISAWITWMAIDAAVLAGMLSQHTIAWQIVAYLIGGSAVVGVSIWKGAAMGWQTIDTVCLLFVALALALWGFSENANLAIILSLVACFVGTIPMWRHLWYGIAQEPLLPWLLALVGGTCGVLGIPEWNIASALTPIVFWGFQITTVLLTLKSKTVRATVL